jgi:hypothetical protein
MSQRANCLNQKERFNLAKRNKRCLKGRTHNPERKVKKEKGIREAWKWKGDRRSVVV